MCAPLSSDYGVKPVYFMTTGHTWSHLGAQEWVTG